jgi:hypothetical protein
MESIIKSWLVLPILLFSGNCLPQCVNGKSQVPCVFIFGDSLSDSGNNNNLSTYAKCNYKPYGIDFPMGPTGRFTNGRTAIDIISNNSFNLSILWTLILYFFCKRVNYIDWTSKCFSLFFSLLTLNFWFSSNYKVFFIEAQLLGFENFTPPFANINGSNILKGVNYTESPSLYEFVLITFHGEYIIAQEGI